MESSSSPSHGQGRGLIPLEQCVQPVELRKPHTINAEDDSTTAATDKSLTTPDDGADQSTGGFQLSVFAQEFVPKTYSTDVNCLVVYDD